MLTDGRLRERHTLPPEVARSLREARNARGLGVCAAARRAGISRTHLSRMEQGARCPSLAVAHALIDGLELEQPLAGELLAVARPESGRSHPAYVRRSRVTATGEHTVY